MADEKKFSLKNDKGQTMTGFFIRRGDLFQVRATGETLCVMTGANYAKVLESGKFVVVEEVPNA